MEIAIAIILVMAAGWLIAVGLGLRSGMRDMSACPRCGDQIGPKGSKRARTMYCKRCGIHYMLRA